MTRYSHLREISILPCLPAGLSVEDEMLSPTAPSFGLQHVYPNAALARALGFLNIPMAQFLALVESRKGIKLTSSKAHGPDTGPWRHRPENAPLWRALKVRHDPALPQLLGDDEIVEIFDNASYGGQLAIAGMADADFCLPSAPYPALRLSGRFQIGIIDYVWGSGHTVTWDGALTVDLTNGQAGDAPGYSFNDTCDFAIDWFRFRMVARAELPKGKLWHAERAVAVAKAA
jgi:hypothetical protein